MCVCVWGGGGGCMRAPLNCNFLLLLFFMMVMH